MSDASVPCAIGMKEILRQKKGERETEKKKFFSLHRRMMSSSCSDSAPLDSSSLVARCWRWPSAAGLAVAAWPRRLAQMLEAGLPIGEALGATRKDFG
jgi:hypothetical protein